MPENSPYRTTSDHHPAGIAYGIYIQEIGIQAGTGINVSRLGSKSDPELRGLILKHHANVAALSASGLAHLNTLRFAGTRLQAGAPQEEVSQFLRLQSFDERQIEAFIKIHQSQNGSEDGAS